MQTYTNNELHQMNPRSPEYVVAHFERQRKKGRNPSVSFRGIKNAFEALKEARKILDDRKKPIVQAFRMVANEVTAPMPVRPQMSMVRKRLLQLTM